MSSQFFALETCLTDTESSLFPTQPVELRFKLNNFGLFKSRQHFAVLYPFSSSLSLFLGRCVNEARMISNILRIHHGIPRLALFRGKSVIGIDPLAVAASPLARGF